MCQGGLLVLVGVDVGWCATQMLIYVLTKQPRGGSSAIFQGGSYKSLGCNVIL